MLTRSRPDENYRMNRHLGKWGKTGKIRTTAVHGEIPLGKLQSSEIKLAYNLRTVVV